MLHITSEFGIFFLAKLASKACILFHVRIITINQNLLISPSPSPFVVLILRIGISRSVLLDSSNQRQITIEA
ncbi:hypothetical protein BI334_23680 [Moorena producens 3L]|nr:hypothetical protein BI334_23680 [Moorena producens 3L]